MNKILSFSLLFSAALAFTACAGEEDDIFKASAAERLNAASALYSSRLEASPNGWAMQLYPTTQDEYPYGSGYLLLMDFDPDFSVKVAMNNRFSSNTYWEDRSVWEVITDNGPVLSFNSFNKCVHAFSDPEDIPWTGTASEAKNEQSEGCGGDYEFIIVDAPDDASYLMLKGKKRGTYNLLTPLEEGVDYEEYLLDVKTFQSTMFPTNELTTDIVHFGDSIYKMDGYSDGIPNIYPYEGDAISESSFNPFLVTKRGDTYYLRFRDEIAIVDNGEDGTVQDFRYDTASDRFIAVDNENCYIEGTDPVPFFYESLPTRWFSWTRTSTQSESMQSYYDAIYDGFRARNLNLTGMGFTVENEGVLSFRIQYRNSKNVSSTVKFLFTLQEDADGMTLNYSSAVDKADNVKTQIPAITDLFNVLSQKFVVSEDVTKFNLTNIKLTAAADDGLWLIVTH